MSWISAEPLPTPAQQRHITLVEKHWGFFWTGASGGWKYTTRPVTTTVEIYSGLEKTFANAQADAMYSDTIDEGVRTVVTATVERQNDADGHQITKTTVVTGIWAPYITPGEE